MKKLISAIFFLSAFFVSARTQEKADKWKILLSESDKQHARAAKYFLIKIANAETVEMLTGKGLQVFRQLSSQHFIVSFPSEKITDFPGAVPANANWKLSPLLSQEMLDNHQKHNRYRKFFLYTNDAVQLQHTISNLSGLDIKIEYSYPGILVISTTLEKLTSKILRIESIRFAESAERQPREERAIPGLDLSVNKINLVHSEFPLLKGDGLTFSLKEQKPDSTDIDLRGRYISSTLSAPNPSAHATVMATMVAGAGNSFSTGKGVAPGSSLLSSDFARLYPDPDSIYRKWKISVQNHSYGTGIENYYGADAGAYDSSTRSNNTLLHVFSSGNAGLSSSTTGVYAGIEAYANLTGSFKMSKNSISVGATDASGFVSPMSSRGPAYDGRLKPELVAFGEDGSSGAAAIVSGVSLLCQEMFSLRNDGRLPDAALIKAVLVNSADDIGAKGIDFISGYGNVNAYKSVKTITEGRYLTGTVTRTGDRRFSLLIPPNAVNLKITLAWTDPASDANAYTALINDLDLELRHVPQNLSWKPWVLNSHAHHDSLMLLPTRKRDSLNNLEQISLEVVPSGSYEIIVSTASVRFEQPFFIAYQWDTVDQFKWTYPSKADNLIPGQSAKIKWSTTISKNATIEYSGNAGRNWEIINQGVDLGSEVYNWQVPDSFHVGLLRMKVNDNIFISDTFTISAPLNLSVGFDCSDSLLLHWTWVENNRYQLYQLGEKYMEAVGIYNDSFAIINKSVIPSLYYAVAPLLEGYRTGTRSAAINYSSQGVGCYFQFFLADLEEKRSRLHFALGSLHDVLQIELQKLEGNIFKTIHVFQAGADFNFYDSLLSKGVNTYRVKLSLSGGRILYSQVEQVYYFGNSDFLIYPNPVASSQPLRILSKNADSLQLRCYSMDGKQLMQRNLINVLEAVTLPLSKGIYLVELVKEGKRVYLQKIVVY